MAATGSTQSRRGHSRSATPYLCCMMSIGGVAGWSSATVRLPSTGIYPEDVVHGTHGSSLKTPPGLGTQVPTYLQTWGNCPETRYHPIWEVAFGRSGCWVSPAKASGFFVAAATKEACVCQRNIPAPARSCMVQGCTGGQALAKETRLQMPKINDTKVLR